MLLFAAAYVVAWLLAAYLLLLGVVALFRPERALAFLSAFARNRRINAAEAIARALAGMALLVLDSKMNWGGVGTIVGAFLVVTALLMLLLPDQHRRLAPLLVGSIQCYMVPFGLASLALSLVLALALLP